MITCNLNGRMGNQMFEIAAAVGTAIKYNVPYLIPNQTINNDLFKPSFPELHNAALMGTGNKRRTFHETKFEYQPIEYKNGTLKLNGYFQSYKYFDHCRKDILKLFPCKAPIKDFVSIHVRHGDYLHSDDFQVLGIYYYYQAIEFFIAKGYKYFFVSSDDIEWCEKNINSNLYPNCHFHYSSGDSKSDLMTMSACEHNIIANSTYSWWAAWLNKNSNKIIICPDTWFKNVNKDLLPKDWIIFKNE